MKLKVLLCGICFLSIMSFSTTVSAEEQCDTIVIDCGNGPVTNGLICGSSGRELVKEAREMADAVCN